MNIFKFCLRLLFYNSLILLLILGCEKNNLITIPKEDSVISKDNVTVKPPEDSVISEDNVTVKPPNVSGEEDEGDNNEKESDLVVEKGGVYYIHNSEELFWIANEVNRSRNNFSGKTVRLMNDIDMENKPFKGIATGGENNRPYYSFEGTFDGNGKKIKGLNIEDISGYYIGFIGYLGKGAVKDLEIESGSVKGRFYVGSIVGRSEGTIENCNNNATIEGAEYVGGIVGYNYGIITGSGNSAKVVVDKGRSEYAGGIAGANKEIVERVYNTGDINGDKYIGGIIGINFKTVNSSYNTGYISGYDFIGGICGRNTDGISNSYNTGNVEALYYLGGGDIRGIIGVAGGIAGINTFGEKYIYPLISTSYNIGEVIGRNVIGGIFGESVIGGILGYKESGDVVLCFYLKGMANYGVDVPETDRGATPISSSKFSEVTTIHWGDSSPWKIKSGLGGSVSARPVLSGVGEEGK